MFHTNHLVGRLWLHMTLTCWLCTTSNSFTRFCLCCMHILPTIALLSTEVGGGTTQSEPLIWHYWLESCCASRWLGGSILVCWNVLLSGEWALLLWRLGGRLDCVAWDLYEIRGWTNCTFRNCDALGERKKQQHIGSFKGKIWCYRTHSKLCPPFLLVSLATSMGGGGL